MIMPHKNTQKERKKREKRSRHPIIPPPSHFPQIWGEHSAVYHISIAPMLQSARSRFTPSAFSPAGSTHSSIPPQHWDKSRTPTTRHKESSTRTPSGPHPTSWPSTRPHCPPTAPYRQGPRLAAPPQRKVASKGSSTLVESRTGSGHCRWRHGWPGKPTATLLPPHGETHTPLVHRGVSRPVRRATLVDWGVVVGGPCRCFVFCCLDVIEVSFDPHFFVFEIVILETLGPIFLFLFIFLFFGSYFLFSKDFRHSRFTRRAVAVPPRIGVAIESRGDASTPCGRANDQGMMKW